MFSAGLLEDLFVPDFVGIWLLQSSSSWICLEDSAGNGLVASDTGLWVKNLELVLTIMEMIWILTAACTQTYKD